MQPDAPWHVHDPERPQPPVVTPGSLPGGAVPAKPPSDAIVLFDGKSLENWQTKEGQPAPWRLENEMMIADKADIISKQQFGDVQLHLEFMTPPPGQAKGQGRSNSGVFLMDRYEIQVLDCFENKTYADGTIGALYGQHPPLVNACLPPGQWQTYDILFTAPRFNADGSVASPAYATVLLNGIVVQNHTAFRGPTAWRTVTRYTPHDTTGPIGLQHHDNHVRFRNIWVRPLQHSRP